jgi:hypothetical protein
MKNTSFHSGIKQCPYTALFGGNPRVGLRSMALPTEILERMVTEDDLFAAFQDPPGATDIPSIPSASSPAADIPSIPSSSSPATADILSIAPTFSLDISGS